MIRINLFPVPTRRKAEALIIQGIVGVVVIILVIVGCHFYGASYGRTIGIYQSRISGVKNQIKSLERTVGRIEQYKKDQADLTQKINVINQLKSGRSGPVRMMEEFSSVLPDKVWITSFREESKKVRVEAEALSQPAISDFIESMKKSKFFQDVKLDRVTAQDKGAVTVYKFNIDFVVRYDV